MQLGVFRRSTIGIWQRRSGKRSDDISCKELERDTVLVLDDYHYVICLELDAFGVRSGELSGSEVGSKPLP